MSVERRRRVNFIKGFLVTAFLAMIITPLVISVAALRYVRQLDRKVDELSDQVAKLELTYMLKAQADDALEDMLENKKEQTIEENELLASQEPEEVRTQNIEEEAEQESRKKVYLTFDDGPSSNTEKILDILDKYDIKATFFVTGYQAEKHPEWYRQIVDRGHAIGMHSYSHVYRDIYSSPENFTADIDKLHDYIEKTTGTDTHIMRFPGSSNRVSSVSMSDLCILAHDRGWEYYDWNISSQDATGSYLTPTQLTYNVLAGLDSHENCIVLMHDAADKNATVSALEGIIEGILSRDDTVILPIDDTTEPVQHLSPVFEEN